MTSQNTLTADQMTMIMLTGNMQAVYNKNGYRGGGAVHAEVPCMDDDLDKGTKKIINSSLKKSIAHKFGRRQSAKPMNFEGNRRGATIKRRLQRKLADKSEE